MTDADIASILADLTAGRIDQIEAERRLAVARQFAGGGPAATAGASTEPEDAEPSGTRVSIRAVGRRVRVLGDASVGTVAVTGPHTLRRSGQVIEVAAEGQGRPLENLNLLNLPRSLDDLRGLGLGTELVVRVNPALVVDAEVTAASFTSQDVPQLGRVRVTGGAASCSGVRRAADVLVQAGSATVSGPFAQGRSRVKCESGALTVRLDEGANVTVRGTANLGRLIWPGDATGVDEWIAGDGTARLDVEVSLGVGTIQDAAVAETVRPDAAAQGPAAGASGSSERGHGGAGGVRCPNCGTVGTGKFCAECGTTLRATCGHCGAELPAGAKFCPECGTPTGH